MASLAPAAVKISLGLKPNNVRRMVRGMCAALAAVLLAVALGGALGFVMQRGRFCLNSAFRDVIFIKDYTMFRAYLLCVVVAILGSTFDGSYEPVKDVCDALDAAHRRSAISGATDRLRLRRFWADLPAGIPTVAVFRDQTAGEFERTLGITRG